MRLVEIWIFTGQQVEQSQIDSWPCIMQRSVIYIVLIIFIHGNVSFPLAGFFLLSSPQIPTFIDYMLSFDLRYMHMPAYAQPPSVQILRSAGSLLAL